MPPIPKNIRSQLQAAQLICDELEQIASAGGYKRKFTLDGRFVGDIGEIIAGQYFHIDLHEKQKHRHDATCLIGKISYGVQIKCRRKSTVIDFYSKPELLLVIQIDEEWKEWEVVYNGSGEILIQDGNYTADEQGRLWHGNKKGRRFDLDDLREFSKKSSNLCVPERDKRLA